ncbi:MAG: metal-dependent hydrolase [Nitrospirae bacterium]|nr:metal-dependent hydrolase [Nitrospirota bacterium]
MENVNLLSTMDPITHALTGITIKNLGFKKKSAFGVLLFTSIAPDLDYISRLWGTDIFLRYHRGITHGIPAMIAVSILIALIFGLRKGFFYYFFLSLLGYGTHIFLDLTNQYGTRILMPFDDMQYSFDLTFIIDPYISIGLLITTIACRINKKRAQAVAGIAILLIGVYIFGRYYLHEKTEDFLRTRLSDSVCKLCPLPNDFLRWWFVAKSNDGIQVGFADLFTKRICIQETYPSQADEPAIERSKDDKVVRSFLYFAKYPYAEVKKQNGKTVVTWKELSFSFIYGEHFVAKVFMDENGKVLSSYFKF